MSETLRAWDLGVPGGDKTIAIQAHMDGWVVVIDNVFEPTAEELRKRQRAKAKPEAKRP